MTSENSQNQHGCTYVFLSASITESFEITLARAVDLTAKGEQLKVIYCDGSETGCSANITRMKSLCSHCQSITLLATSEHLPNQKPIPLSKIPLIENAPFSESSSKDITKLSLRESSISTIKTFYRVDVGRSNKNRIHALFFSKILDGLDLYSLYVHKKICSLIASTNIRRIEFFNGRIVPTKAIMEAARNSKVNFGVIEVFGKNRSLYVTDSSAVQDLDYLRDQVRTFTLSKKVDAELGNEFFEKRRVGVFTNDQSYIGHQKYGKIRKLGNKKLVSVFPSSTDEFEVMGDQWITPASAEPVKFILDLRKKLSSDYHLVVRMHPNQQGDRTGKSSAMIRELSDVGGLELIKPLNIASTYELIDLSDAVVTFGSSVGLESTYWGKPSYLAGRAVWDDIDVAYKVNEASDVVELIKKNVMPKSKTEAVKVGAYYMQDKGEASCLTWGENGKYGFFIDGKGYLEMKRSSPSYLANRLVDKFLRLNW